MTSENDLKWPISNPVLLLGYSVRVLIAAVISVLLVAGLVLKFKIFNYIGKQGLKRPLNALLYTNHMANSGETRPHFNDASKYSN